MFQVNQIDLEYMFELMGQTVLINDVERKTIITNKTLSENEERYLHTLDKVSMGDLVSIDDEKFLIMTETITKRNGKYKALIRHCNYVIEIPTIVQELIGYDSYGRPVYQDVEGEPILIPSIVENKSFAVSGSQLLVADNQIIVIVQDNEVNRNKFAVNGTFNLMDKNWKVLNDDRTKRGLLILTCEMTA
ncbi:hypothetical protein [Bacillus benzoevorans]|uniref:Uncharacterized protein n=1 Tax=Bacillus benzoevorans TaxID=1456 RepID=A0A7X0LVP2_9BACI|nr:hypothetical protein [Bacillus benzoevorans]MBB6445828.1 hypothetical protein [Bacillus benzoevorans]